MTEISPARAPSARQRAARSLSGIAPALVVRLLFGDDVFISYARADAANYALKLASELTRHGLSCFVDQWGTPPGLALPSAVRLAVKCSSLFVLIGSPAAARSEAVEAEVEQFLSTSRPLIPISIGGSIERSDRWNRIAGLALTEESAEALSAGTPSESVLNRIVHAEGFVRRNTKLRRIFWGTAAAVALLVAVGVVAVAVLQRRADAEQQRADGEQRRADAEQRLATARELANRAESVRGVSGEGLLQSTVLAVRSIAVRPTLEGDLALRRNLSLLARQRSSETMDGVESMAFSNDGGCMVSMAADRIEVRKLAADAPVTAINATGRYLAISRDCHVVAIGAGDRVKVFDIGSGEERASFQAVDSGDLVGPLALTSNGRYLALVNRNEHLDFGPSVVDLETKAHVFEAPAQGHISQVAFSGDDQYLAASGARNQTRGFARVWRLNRSGDPGELEEQLAFYQVGVLDAIALDEAGRTLVVAAGSSVAVWRRFDSVNEYREISRLPTTGGRPPAIEAMAFSATGDELVLARQQTPGLQQRIGRILERWGTEGYRDVIHRTFEDRLHFLTFSDASNLQMAGEGYAQDRARRRTWNVASDQVTLFPAGTDTSLLRVAEAAKRITSDPRWEQRLLAVSDEGTVVAFSAKEIHGQRSAGFSRPTIARVYRVTESIELVGSFDAERPLNDVKLTPDGHHVIVADDTGVVRVWEVGTGKEVRLESFAEPIQFAFLAVSPRNGYMLVSRRGFSAPTAVAPVKLWHPATGRLRTTIAEGGPLTAAAFDRDERLLAVADAWGTVHVWDLENVTPIARLDGHFDIAALAISTDRRLVAVASREDSGIWSGLVQVFSLDRADLLRNACRRLPEAFATQAGCRDALGKLSVEERAGVR